MTDRSATFAVLLCSAAACVALLLLHVALARLWFARHPLMSPQKATVQLSLALNLPLVLVLALHPAVPSGTDFAWSVVWSLMFFNFFAYAYFHVFNLSETGRRIRLLLQLLDSGERFTPVSALAEKGYDGRYMVEQRLERLTQMGQIKRIGAPVPADDCYRLSSRTMWRIGRFVHLLGMLATRRREVN
jgi:hypothetical protein